MSRKRKHRSSKSKSAAAPSASDTDEVQVAPEEAAPSEVLAEGSGPVESVAAHVAVDDGEPTSAADLAEAMESVEAAEAAEVVDVEELPEIAELEASAANEPAGEAEPVEAAEPGEAEPVEAAAAASDDELIEVDEAETGATLPTSATALDAVQLKYLVEALVFASDKPITVQRLRQLTRVADTKRLEQALAELGEDYRERGIILQQVSGGWQFRTRTQWAAWVQQLIAGRPVRLSRAQLETLAIVAYRQPITRPEIDEIRGVDSSGTLKVLIDRSLIRILGKKEEVGRPMLYGTTKEFLDFFSLGDLRELPTLREYSELTDESRKVMSDRLGIAPDKPDPDGGEGGTSGDGGSMPPSGDGDGGAGSDTPADVGAAPEVVDLDEVFARAPEPAQAETGASWIAAIRAEASAPDPAPGDSPGDTPGDSSEPPDAAPDEPAADDDHGGDTATVLEQGPRAFDDEPSVASDDGLGDATVAEKPDAANVDEPEDKPEQDAATPDGPILDVTDRQILEARDDVEAATPVEAANAIATADADDAACTDDGEFADGSGPTLEPTIPAGDAVVQMSYEPDASWPDASDGVEVELAPRAATELSADDDLAPEHFVIADSQEPSLASITTLAADVPDGTEPSDPSGSDAAHEAAPFEHFDAAAASALPIGLGMTASHSDETLEPDGDRRSELVPPTIEPDPRSLGETSSSSEPVSD